MKIAIIGGGISGLTAAYHLHTRHQITLYEAEGRLGGHTHTVPVEIDGERHAIDTGFIVFNDRTYPGFVALLDELRVPSQPTTMSFSVRCDRTGLEYNGGSLNGLFAQRRNLFRPGFHRLLRDILRFGREAPALLVSSCAGEPTVAEYLAAHRYSQQFVSQYLLPMGSAIWSCPLGTFARFPMRFIVEFYQNHGLLQVSGRPQWRVISGGSARYVEALTRGFRDRVRLGTPVRSVRRHDDHAELIVGQGETAQFDHVIFACHSDQALRLLADPSSLERDVLGAFPYERNTAVLHTDPSVLPRTRRAWAAWNYHLPRQPSDRATVTYLMNRLQGLVSRHAYCVTLNGEEGIDPARIIQQIVYHHPVFTTGRAAAQARHAELLADRRTSYCGAYWGNGFHEDGVQSALAVCRAIAAHASPCTAPFMKGGSGIDARRPSATSSAIACS